MPNEILTAALKVLTAGRDLSAGTAQNVLGEIMDGRASDVQTAAVLAALHTKGETAAEIVGFARAMTERAAKVDLDADVILDTCGTGGDAADTFNISTAAAFVAAGAGAVVAKHGNRSASGRCGSADVLEELGVTIELSPDKVAACIRRLGIGFMYAPLHHRAMARVAPVRRELGVRTIFNVVGPLTNPAGARHQLIGVGRQELLPTMAQAVRTLGSARNLLVHSGDGMDEIGISGATELVEVFADRGFDRHTVLTPEGAGVERAPLEAIRGGDRAQNAEIVREVLAGTPGPCLDVVLLNAGAALFIAEAAPDIPSGVELARAAVASGAAAEKLESLIATTRLLHDETGPAREDVQSREGGLP